MDEEESLPLECSSGSESGWTMYLDQSFGRPTSLSAKGAGLHGRFVGEEEEEEEEDLSMISDASSGPPQFHEEEDNCYDNGCFCSASSTALVTKISKRSRAEAKEKTEDSSYLDDTASSHVFLFSKNSSEVTNNQLSMEDAFDFSVGFSATHFNKYSNIVQSSSIPVQPTSAKPVCREEGRRNKIC
ncbi:hypothetical protein MRB53_012538 [Persea americana]|uniref:Uncharacterized protein n=1 Tax=Persea americana TaxID=3435 RepID=A0ACC2LYW2_PERAE|nr:hypothetical protein MRB53_012538 [Persea americana]